MSNPNTNPGTWSSGFGADINTVFGTYAKQIKFLLARKDLAGAQALWVTMQGYITTLKGQLDNAVTDGLVSHLPNTRTVPDPILYPVDQLAEY